MVASLASRPNHIPGNSSTGTSATHTFTLGGGLRFQPNWAGQFLIGGGFSSLASDNGCGSTNGFAVKAIAFYPVAYGFGPYVQLGYNRFSPTGVTLDLFTANAGISFSYWPFNKYVGGLVRESPDAVSRQQICPQPLDRHGAVAHQSLVEAALVEFSAGSDFGLQRLNLGEAKKVLAELS